MDVALLLQPLQLSNGHPEAERVRERMVARCFDGVVLAFNRGALHGFDVLKVSAGKRRQRPWEPTALFTVE